MLLHLLGAGEVAGADQGRAFAVGGDDQGAEGQVGEVGETGAEGGGEGGGRLGGVCGGGLGARGGREGQRESECGDGGERGECRRRSDK